MASNSELGLSAQFALAFAEVGKRGYPQPLERFVEAHPELTPEQLAGIAMLIFAINHLALSAVTYEPTTLNEKFGDLLATTLQRLSQTEKINK